MDRLNFYRYIHKDCSVTFKLNTVQKWGERVWRGRESHKEQL